MLFGMFLILIISVVSTIFIAVLIDFISMSKKNYIKALDLGGITMWAIVISLLICLITPFVFIAAENTLNIVSEKFDHYGSFIGGLVGSVLSFAGIVLILQTLQDQDEDFKLQKNESRFLTLISIHRDNVKSLELKGKNSQDAIKWMRKEMYHLYKIIDLIDRDKKNGMSATEKIGLCYIAFYFGSSSHRSSSSGESNLSNKAFITKANGEFRSDVVDELISRTTNKRKEIKKKFNFSYGLFDGHQTRFGHYFRHLYLIVKWVDGLDISYSDKYLYVKTLRVQLSTDEQIFLFYNSISSIGVKWGYNSEDPNKDLITKYNLIKNIPEGFGPFDSIEPSIFYPDVKFEGKDFSVNKLRFIKEDYK